MKQRKSTEAKEEMGKDNQSITIKNLLPELGAMIFAALLIFLSGIILKLDILVMVTGIIMAVLGTAVVGYQFRKQYIKRALAYDNNEHFYRFWCYFAAGILISVVCIFLPVGSWPFLVVYVMLALTSDAWTGMLAGTVLLMIPSISGGIGATAFFLYFTYNAFAIILFSEVKDDFKVGKPLFLSMLCMLLCETANVILPANSRLRIELFVIPISNIFISGISLIGILRLFSAKIIYQYRNRYLELNDSENKYLMELKEQSRNDYMYCIHATHFCESIALRLGFDVDALKCAGYYHRAGKKMEELLAEKEFPPKVSAILQEYTKGKCFLKETAVLYCSTNVIQTIMKLQATDKGAALNYDQIIDTLFQKFDERKVFDSCEISLKDYRLMHKIFKEEKLYYDFFCGK